MSNNIIEILDILEKRKKWYLHQQKNNSPFNDEHYIAYMVLDYITNLQEENERLKQPQIFIDTMDMEERYGEELYKEYLKKQLKDCKQRIKKAIEYIENNDDDWFSVVELIGILEGEDK